MPNTRAESFEPVPNVVPRQLRSVADVYTLEKRLLSVDLARLTHRARRRRAGLSQLPTVNVAVAMLTLALAAEPSPTPRPRATRAGIVLAVSGAAFIAGISFIAASASQVTLATQRPPNAARPRSLASTT